jgi:hypothetical protein
MYPGCTGTSLTGHDGLHKMWPWLHEHHNHWWKALGVRVQDSQDMLDPTKSDSDFIYTIIKGDKSWVYGYKSHRTCWTPHTVTLTLWKPELLLMYPVCTGTILTGHAGLRKQWPRLQEHHNHRWWVVDARVKVSQHILDSTHSDPEFMNTIITGDVSCVYGYKPHRTCWTPHTVTLTSWTP